jgi:hypothetical protein
MNKYLILKEVFDQEEKETQTFSLEEFIATATRRVYRKRVRDEKALRAAP